MELYYLSDIQWDEKEKELYLNSIENWISNVFSNKKSSYLIINGDIGNKGELIDRIMEILLKNKEKIEENNNKVIVNFGNHDLVLKALYYENLLENVGNKNIILVTEPKLIEIEGKNFLFVPGAHQISGPGSFFKNVLYSEKGLMPTGYYLRIINDEKDEYIKINKNFAKKLANYFFFREFIKKEYEKEINNLKNKKNLSEEEKKLLENLKSEYEELENLYEGLNSGKFDLIYHVNSLEIKDNFKNKDIFALISHDPVKYSEKLGNVKGYEAEKDFDIILRIKSNGKYKETKIKINKGKYSILQLHYNLYNHILSAFYKEFQRTKDESILLNLNENYISDLVNKIINYHSKIGNLKEVEINTADPYLSEIKANFHLGGHIEGKYVLVDRENKFLYLNKETDSLYANIHTKRMPIKKEDNYYSINIPKFEINNKKIKFGLEKLLEV